MPVNTRIQLRRGTAAAGAAQWTDQVLYAGEVGYETDTGKFKIGDGTTAWNSLGYASVLPSELNELVDDRINGLLVAGTGVALSYNDGSNSLTIAVTGVSLSGHTHTASNITDFNTAVSGLLPVKDVVAGSGISVSSSSGSFTVSLSDPTIQAADVTDFSEAVDDRVSNLLVAGSGVSISYNDSSNTLTVSSSLTAGSGIAVSESSGVYTVSLSDPTIQVADITDLTASATELNYLDGSIPGTGVADKAIVLDSSRNIANLGDVTTTGTVTVGGNLIVNGTTTTVNSTVTTLDDPVITLGGDTAPSSNDSKDRGVEFRWHNGTSAKLGFFGYDNSTGKFTFIPDATNTSEAFSGTTGELDAKIDWSNVNSKPDPVIAVDLTGDVTGSGNLTMTDLAGGTISITTTVAANSVTLGTDTTGDYVASIANGSYITGGGTGSEGAALTLAVDATSTNTASKVVARDSSGDFAAGNITASGLTNATLTNCVIDGGTP